MTENTLEPRMSRRQFLGLLGTGVAATGATLLTNELKDKKGLWQIVKAVTDQYPWDNEFLGISTQVEAVKKELQKILPADKQRGGIFLFWEGNQFVFSENVSFAHGSMIKAVLATYAISKDIQMSDQEWRNLLIVSSDVAQIALANRILKQQGIINSQFERESLLSRICSGFGMNRTDAYQGCLRDYGHFWMGILDNQLLNQRKKEYLLDRMFSEDIADVWQRYGFNFFATMEGLKSPGKIGIAGSEETVFSAILAITDKKTDRLLVAGGCFFTDKDNNKAFKRYFDFHQFVLALAKSVQSKN